VATRYPVDDHKDLRILVFAPVVMILTAIVFGLVLSIS
jgi:hypothetical protein